jgi:hypothetical protein
MRDKKWVEFIPAEPDVDAVAKDFYVFKSKAAAGSGGKKFFRTGQVNLMLEIECDKYQEILEYRASEHGTTKANLKEGENTRLSYQ